MKINNNNNNNVEIIEQVNKREINGDFIAVNCVNMTCRCAKSKYGISPSCHTSNGYADLIVVRKTSRINYIRYLLRLSRNHSFVSKPFRRDIKSNFIVFLFRLICLLLKYTG